MKPFKITIITASTLILLSFANCTESTNKQEEIEIKKMDSTSKTIKENTEKLETQTKKVEESLEQLDKEFSDNK